MNTIWQHTVYVICSADSISGAIAALDLAFPRDDGIARDPSKPEEYSCLLSASGIFPATHYGSSFSITEIIRQQLEDLGLAQTPGISYWRVSNPDGILQSSNWPNQQIGIPFIFDDALSVMGLKRSQEEEPK